MLGEYGIYGQLRVNITNLGQIRLNVGKCR